MTRTHRTRMNQITVFAVLTLGVILVVLSAFYVSSYLAILGVAIVFWGAILLFITPSKHVPLTLLNVSADSSASNIERILSELNLTEKGVYLPPNRLKSIESSLVFIPETPKTPLPKREDITEKLHPNRKDGVFLTPPGLALSQLLEKELGVSFTRTNLAHLQRMLPKLIEDAELAEDAQIQTLNNTITVELTGSILTEVCIETRKNPKTHEQVGCLLSSAIACALAKATGKAITIEKETRSPDLKTTRIEYQIIGE